MDHNHFSLMVSTGDTTVRLGSGDELTFGRDSSCTMRLDPADRGISRIAGRIRCHADGWYVTNLSTKRVLHIVDATGIATPLPVIRHGWPVSRRALDQPKMTVLVPGEVWTYAVTIEGPAVNGSTSMPAPADPLTTRDATLRLTDNRREVLVALARGYLRPYPHYDPKPRGYEDVASQLGLSRTQVTRRIEDIRNHLVEAGIEGLDSGRDGRRALCEWLLSMRLVTAADLAWLESRIRDRQKQRADAARFAQLPKTRIAHAAHTAARAVAPHLGARLVQVRGPHWLDAVNAARSAHGMRPGTSLDDDRFCLAVFGHDTATAGWADQLTRAAAAALRKLANTASHEAPSAETAAEAQRHCETLTAWARTRHRPGNS